MKIADLHVHWKSCTNNQTLTPSAAADGFNLENIVEWLSYAQQEKSTMLFFSELKSFYWSHANGYKLHTVAI